MTIERDLSGLPTRGSFATWEPEATGLLAPAVEAWWREHEEAGLERAKADETLPYRASWASLRCDRQLWYALHGVEQSNPMSVADHWRMATGSMGHALLQDKLAAGLGERQGLALEQAVDLSPIGIPGSGHADGIVYETNTDGTLMHPVEVIELKTVGGFQFKIMTLPFKGGPRGPRYEAVVQGAMMAAALGCALRVCYVSLELVGAEISKDRTLGEDRRFAAEWVLDADTCAAIAADEASRIDAILHDDYVSVPLLHDLEVEPGAVVTNQDRGTWVAQTEAGPVHGKTWRCGYCGQRERCIQDGI